METMQKAGCTVEEMIAGVERLAKVMKPIEETDISVINAEPIIEAVPLLPLCKLLAEIVGKPCYTQPGQEICDVTLGDFNHCGKNDEAGCWEHLLRTWMDNGMEDYK